LTAAVTDQHVRPSYEFVALGMAAEIVVIVENKNAGLRSERAAIKPCSRKPADAAANHDQIVALFGCGLIDAEALAFPRECMRDLE
jgi:hypothetical protein